MSIEPTEPIPNPDKGRMLPGIAGIAMFLLFFTLLNVFAALNGMAGNGAQKFGGLALCSILVIGLFGLLRMRRWGYSIVLAGCLLLSASYFYLFSTSLPHDGRRLVQGCFALVFFFYLVRPEVRDRML